MKTEIISFSGKSGTGKSYQAARLCADIGAEAIIDDGLYIYKNQIIAGKSAKRSKTKAEAMRITLFDRESHRREVQLAIKNTEPKKILIIGTSDRMVDWIVRALKLPDPVERIYIEDRSTAKDRAKAQKSREQAGEHVIPVPMIELKRDFAGYFMNPVKILQNFRIGKQKKEEKTVVRPRFGYNGKFLISEKAILDIVEITSDNYSNYFKIIKIANKGNSANFSLNIEIEIKETKLIIAKALEFQTELKKEIEEMTSFLVNSVNILIKEIQIPRNVLFGKKDSRY